MSSYPRTHKEFTLDEVCYIIARLLDGVDVEDLADLVERDSWFLRFKFLETRPVNADGTLDYSRSVEDEEEEDEEALREEFRTEYMEGYLEICMEVEDDEIF